MESKLKKLGFEGSKKLKTATLRHNIKNVVKFLKENINEDDHRPAISLGLGDPSGFKCFRTATIAEDAIVEALCSAKFNSYAPTGGIFPARRIPQYLSSDLPYQLSPDDVYVTVGCKHAIEAIVKVLARPEANILLPSPGVTVGMKKWLRITFAVEYSSLEDGLGRLKSFCQRHAKKRNLTGSTAVDQQIHFKH